jgi:DNA-binding transcriptional LysR family regulator
MFAAVAESENYSRAAQQLHMTQPNVYVQIRVLEKELGCRLFDQVGKRAVLTEAGRALLEYAKHILRLEHDAVVLMQDFRGLRTGQLAIGGGPIVGNYVLPSLMASFKKRFPDIDLKLQIYLPGADPIGDLVSFNVDMVFVSLINPAVPHMVVEEIYHDPLLLCVGGGHPLAERRTVAAADLANEPFVWFGDNTQARRRGEARLRALGVEPRPAMVLNSPEAVKAAVMSNYGVTVLPRLAIAQELSMGRLCTLSLAGFSGELPICFVRHEARRLSPAGHAFLQLAKESAKFSQTTSRGSVSRHPDPREGETADFL